MLSSTRYFSGTSTFSCGPSSRGSVITPVRAEAAQVSSQVGVDFETGLNNLFQAVAEPANFDRWWFGQLITTQTGPVVSRVTSHFGEGSPLHYMARVALDSEQNTIAEATRLGEWVLGLSGLVAVRRRRAC